MTNSYHPIEQGKRTAIVDILRGWAILGVVIGNYCGLPHINVPNETNSVLSEILSKFDQFFFAGKSWTLLTILFGYGFAILINNVTAKGKTLLLFLAGECFCFLYWLLFILLFGLGTF